MVCSSRQCEGELSRTERAVRQLSESAVGLRTVEVYLCEKLVIKAHRESWGIEKISVPCGILSSSS